MPIFLNNILRYYWSKNNVKQLRILLDLHKEWAHLGNNSQRRMYIYSNVKWAFLSWQSVTSRPLRQESLVHLDINNAFVIDILFEECATLHVSVNTYTIQDRPSFIENLPLKISYECPNWKQTTVSSTHKYDSCAACSSHFQRVNFDDHSSTISYHIQ